MNQSISLSLRQALKPIDVLGLQKQAEIKAIQLFIPAVFLYILFSVRHILYYDFNSKLVGRGDEFR